MRAFRAARDKLRKQMDSQTSSLEKFKSIRVFDPRKLPTLCRDITSFSNFPGSSKSKIGIFQEGTIYRNTGYNFDESFDDVSVWKQKQQSLPIL